MIKKFQVPIKIESESNKVQHWAIKNKRKKKQQEAVRLFWKTHIDKKFSIPTKVTLTRFSPRFFDDDNLVAAFKFVRDAIADLLIPGCAPGFADANGNILFIYKQEKVKKQHYIEIEVEEL